MADAPSLRDTIAAAAEQHTETTDTTPPPVVEAETATAPPEPVETETAEQKAERVRDEGGRFAKKPGPTPGEVEARKPAGTPAARGKGTATEIPTAAAPAPAEKPPEPKAVKVPTSWKPQVQELAKKLPAEFHPILEESHRRDLETTRVLNETAQVRQFAQGVQQSLAPYESIARANGTDAMTWAGQALQERAAVMAGAPDHAVKVVAQAVQVLTQRFGPQALDMINAAMGGQAPQGAPMPPPVDVNAQVEKAIEARLAKVTEQRAMSEAEAFVATQPEFMDTVWQDMVGIIQAARMQGAKMTYQDAYDRAVWANPDTRAALEARRAAQSTQAQTASVQQAKKAAVSIKPNPAAAATRPTGPKSLRETVEEAMQAQRT